MGVVPILVVVGWIIGQDLTLYFENFETAVLLIVRNKLFLSPDPSLRIVIHVERAPCEPFDPGWKVKLARGTYVGSVHLVPQSQRIRKCSLLIPTGSGPLLHHCPRNVSTTVSPPDLCPLTNRSSQVGVVKHGHSRCIAARLRYKPRL